MLVGKTIGNTFIIEKELGSGAMGTVYLARYIDDDRLIALKIIALGLLGSDTALARFEREAVILKQLKHPNIVRLFATGKWRGTPFIAMEYVEGESLDRTMARRDRFTWQEVIDIGKQLCAALRHAHERSIIHRDLKPSNLMLTNDGVVKLTDFGIAKDLDVTALTGANNTIGTAAYMSPEQCRGEKFLTGKSDLYSLGIVFFELLTGRKPFIADSSVDMFLMHVSEAPPRVRGQPGCLDIPQALDTLVHQLMDKKPDHRPRDAALVGEALEEIERKEIARLSRGEEVAKARLVDPVEMAPIDETDRRAAKTIRAGAKKKKIKNRRDAFYRQGWFVVVGSIAIVLLTSLIAWLLLRPDGPDDMYAAVKNAKTQPVRLEAAKRYLDVYGRNHPELAEKTEWVKEVYWNSKVGDRERVLLNRHRLPALRDTVQEGEDPDAYRQTMAALTAEEDGDISIARSSWSELIKLKDDPNEGKALWGWVAAKRLKDLDQIDAYLAQVKRKIDNERDDDKIETDDKNLAQAIKAERYHLFDDDDRALSHWEHLAAELKGNAELRNWYLLAGLKSHELKSHDTALAAGRRMTLEQRKNMIQKKLATAEADLAKFVKDTDNRKPLDNVRQICRNVRDLYDGAGDEALKDLVMKARALLEKASH
jgi:eukaryotic-like serine/threonine-protein kinase